MTPFKLDTGRRRLGLIFGALGVFLLLSYALFAALPYLLGPSLTLEASTSTEGITTVSGATKRVSFLEIDGAPVSLEESGSFSVTRAYPSGYTVVQAEARDRFGRTITKTTTFTVPTTTIYGEKENRESTTTGAVIR